VFYFSNIRQFEWLIFSGKRRIFMMQSYRKDWFSAYIFLTNK